MMHWCAVPLLAVLAVGSVPAQEAVDGRAIFNASCSSCHGLDARGGEHGPNITQLDAKLDLAAIVKNGIAARGMPAFVDSLRSSSCEALLPSPSLRSSVTASMSPRMSNLLIC